MSLVALGALFASMFYDFLSKEFGDIRRVLNSFDRGVLVQMIYFLENGKMGWKVLYGYVDTRL